VLRRRAVIALLTVMLTVAAAAAGSAAATPAAQPTHLGLLTRCLGAVAGLGKAPARPVTGSADPGLVATVGLLRRPRTTADAIPATKRVAQVLGAGGASTYDPSATIRVSDSADGTVVYAIPATVGSRPLPARCATLPHASAIADVAAFDAGLTGSGPGVCLLAIAAPGASPGAAALPVGAPCESAAVVAGYLGAIGVTPAETRQAIVPDGITAIDYTLADGRQASVPVVDNRASPPFNARLKLQATTAQVRASFSANLPPTATELGPAGTPVATLTRPPGLFHQAVTGFSYLEKLLSASATVTSSGSAGSQTSCDAKTHRCVTVTISSTCPNSGPCHLGRRIHRFRSMRAAQGSGHVNPLLLAPIRTRVDREIRHPHKVFLVLTGAPQRRVGALVSVTCRSPAGASGEALGPLKVVSVPGRTPVSLPGSAGKSVGCSVDAFVTSSQPGAIHARLVNH
jgi:hypothetical protein